MFTHTHSSSVSSTSNTNNSFLSFFLSIPPPPPPRAMYTNYNITFSRATDSLNHFPSPPEATTVPPMEYSTTPQHQHQHHYQLTLRDYDTVSQLNSDQMSCNAASNNYYNSCSSGCTSYMESLSSLASYESQRVSSRFMQRSVSNHKLRKNNGTHHHYPVSSLFAELLDSANGPVRRVYSTGDLQRINGIRHYQQSESSLSSESSMIIEGMSRTSPYSPEEKKVRIERYRSKRNQRNFNKKIKYACRKTLADSRPRIRGRFARNDEIVMNLPVSTGEEEDEEDHENWDNFFDSLVSANLVQEPQVFY